MSGLPHNTPYKKNGGQHDYIAGSRKIFFIVRKAVIFSTMLPLEAAVSIKQLPPLLVLGTVVVVVEPGRVVVVDVVVVVEVVVVVVAGTVVVVVVAPGRVVVDDVVDEVVVDVVAGTVVVVDEVVVVVVVPGRVVVVVVEAVPWYSWAPISTVILTGLGRCSMSSRRASGGAPLSPMSITGEAAVR